MRKLSPRGSRSPKHSLDVQERVEEGSSPALP